MDVPRHRPPARRFVRSIAWVALVVTAIWAGRSLLEGEWVNPSNYVPLFVVGLAVIGWLDLQEGRSGSLVR